MIPIAVHIVFLSLYAVLFIIIFVQNSTVRDDLDGIRSEVRLQERNLNSFAWRVAQLESDYRSRISKPSDGTRVTVRGDRSNPVLVRLDPDKIVTGSFDMSKIETVTVPPEKILNFENQRDAGETTITIGVKHD